MGRSTVTDLGQCVDLGVGSVLNRPYNDFTRRKETGLVAGDAKINVPSLPYRVIEKSKEITYVLGWPGSLTGLFSP